MRHARTSRLPQPHNEQSWRQVWKESNQNPNAAKNQQDAQPRGAISKAISGLPTLEPLPIGSHPQEQIHNVKACGILQTNTSANVQVSARVLAKSKNLAQVQTCLKKYVMSVSILHNNLSMQKAHN